MMAPTHLAFAGLVGSLTGTPQYAFLLLGSLFPDIDHPNSTLGRFIPLGYFIRHRTITHSLLALAIALYANPWFGVGYATHLFLDALNPSRVPMLYPYEKKFGIGLIRTGSVVEKLLFIFICLGLFFKYSKGVGL